MRNLVTPIGSDDKRNQIFSARSFLEITDFSAKHRSFAFRSRQLPAIESPKLWGASYVRCPHAKGSVGADAEKCKFVFFVRTEGKNREKKMHFQIMTYSSLSPKATVVVSTSFPPLLLKFQFHGSSN